MQAAVQAYHPQGEKHDLLGLDCDEAKASGAYSKGRHCVSSMNSSIGAPFGRQTVRVAQPKAELHVSDGSVPRQTTAHIG